MGVKQNQTDAAVVEVAVALPVFGTFTYTVPPSWAGHLAAGMRVLVPFGARRTTGYVLGPAADALDRELRPVADILDDAPLLPAALLPWLRWMADYYRHPLGETIRTALPGGLTAYDAAVVGISPDGLAALGTGRPAGPEGPLLERLRNGPVRLRTLRREFPDAGLAALVGRLERRGWVERQWRLVRGATRPKTERVVRLRHPPERVAPRAVARRRLLDRLSDGEARTLAELRAEVRTAGSLVRALAEEGVVAVEERPVFRDPFGESIRGDRPPALNRDQAAAVAAVVDAMGAGFASLVLAGVTGSGKTEVYLHAAAEALARGRNVLVLAPEIALISQLERRFRARFGERVALLHSGLSAGERFDQWRRIARGEAHVAIGARSAVFAPFAAVGLVVVDEEHDGAFKQETGLRYNARDMALVRAQRDGAVALLGSATPSMAALHAVRQGRYRRLALPERIHRRPLPCIEVVDLRRHRDLRGARRFVTPPLLAAMDAALGRGEQVLLFLNRRGFAAYPVCAACGAALRCPQCDISLTLHQSHNAYRCHYCGYARAAASPCPACGSARILRLGLGTEKVEAAVRALFPAARVARMDRDSVSRRDRLLQLLRQLRSREIDVLVGTQMVAKGHDFPGITVVGVLCADLTLNFPDFRAGERTFQLLAQVAGRAGRGDQPGRVLVQTFNPDHFSIEAARHQDPERFYAQEIGLRAALGYPPLTRLVMVRVSARDPARAEAAARRLGDLCRERTADPEGTRVLGPVPAPLARVAGRHRWQILLKDEDRKRLHRVVEALQREAAAWPSRRVRIVFDVDPQAMM